MQKEIPVKKRSGYLPTLDGWRAIAIVSVLLTHDELHTFGIFSTGYPYLYGRQGVDIFFAISGILICSRLLEEESLWGRISLRRFYMRRLFRIIPAALFYLSVLAALTAAGVLHIAKGEWFASLLFYRNYPRLFDGASTPQSWFTGHFWSLSVEEHFYLLLPSLLIFLPKRMRVPTLLSLAGAVICFRLFLTTHRQANQVMFHTEMRLDELLIPAALAVFLRSNPARWKGYAMLRWWPVYAVLAACVLPGVKSFAWQISLLAILLPLTIAGSVLHADNPLGRLLESKPLRFVGQISYSIYLWQSLFFVQHEFGSFPLGWLERWPFDYIATFACALFSFYVVEKPMMRLGHRFAPTATPGREGIPASAAATPQTAIVPQPTAGE